MIKFVVFAVVVLSAACCGGSPVSSSSDDLANGLQQQQQYVVIREDELVQKLNAKCSAKDVSSCVMLKLVTYMNKLMKKNSVEIGELMEISKKDGGDDDGHEEESVPADVVRVKDSGRGAGYSDEIAFGEVMADKLYKYVQSRSLKIKVLPEADFVVSASPEQDGSLNFGMSFRSGKDLESGERYYPRFRTTTPTTFVARFHSSSIARTTCPPREDRVRPEFEFLVEKYDSVFRHAPIIRFYVLSNSAV